MHLELQPARKHWAPPGPKRTIGPTLAGFEESGLPRPVYSSQANGEIRNPHEANPTTYKSQGPPSLDPRARHFPAQSQDSLVEGTLLKLFKVKPKGKSHSSGFPNFVLPKLNLRSGHPLSESSRCFARPARCPGASTPGRLQTHPQLLAAAMAATSAARGASWNSKE